MPLIIIGDDSFQQSGPPEWRRSIFDLDQMILPFQGGIDKLDAYLASLVEFQPSPVDPNMFLSDWIPDQHKQFPTVRHVYIGRKDGELPSGKLVDDDAVMTASSVSSGVIGSILLNDPVNVQYYGPRSTLTWISFTEGAPGPSGLPADPGGPLESITGYVWTLSLSSGGDGSFKFFVGQQLFSADTTKGSFIVQVTAVGPAGNITAFNTVTATPPPGGPTNPVAASPGNASFNFIQIPIFAGGPGVRVITITWRDAELVQYTDIVSYLLQNYFHPQIIATTRSEQMIPGRYWRNTMTKTRVLLPGSAIFTQPNP